MSASSQQRRRLDGTSDSSGHAPSPTLEQDLAANLRLLSLLEPITETSPELFASSDPSITPTSPVVTFGETEHALHRMLSLHSQNSTTSSAAERHDLAQSKDVESYIKIGAGACGAVFAQGGKSLVIKVAKTNDDSLWNDYLSHASIEACFREHGCKDVKIPGCYFFAPKDDYSYLHQHPNLAEAVQRVCNLPAHVLVSERILPLTKPIRTLLIDKYCPIRIKKNAAADIANKDCLVRVYLGSLQGRSNRMFFSLRNFKLHLNQMEGLRLDVEQFAARMATAMAIMHWAAKTDARDVEFVLGSSSTKVPLAMDAAQLKGLTHPTYTGPSSRMHEDFFHRTTELWVLDFNQVHSITFDEAGVEKAINAARINDPYFPKPQQESRIEKLVWNAFVSSYIAKSLEILAKDGYDQETFALPYMFIRGLVDTQLSKSSTDLN